MAGGQLDRSRSNESRRQDTAPRCRDTPTACRLVAVRDNASWSSASCDCFGHAAGSHQITNSLVNILGVAGEGSFVRAHFGTLCPGIFSVQHSFSHDSLNRRLSPETGARRKVPPNPAGEEHPRSASRGQSACSTRVSNPPALSGPECSGSGGVVGGNLPWPGRGP